MKRVLGGIAIAMLVASGAFAGDELMSVYFGNTLTATDANGTTKIYYSADHTWRSAGPQGNANGTWEVKGTNQLCVTTVAPPPPAGAPNPSCVTIDPHKVGDAWDWTPPGASAPTKLAVVAGT